MRGVYAAFSKKCSNFGLSKPLSNLYTQKLILDENEKGNNYIRHARALGSSKLVIYTKKSLEGNPKPRCLGLLCYVLGIFVVRALGSTAQLNSLLIAPTDLCGVSRRDAKSVGDVARPWNVCLGCVCAVRPCV